MGSTAEVTEPTEKHQPVEIEEAAEEEEIVDLERKTSSFRHGNERISTDTTTSTITTNTSSSSSFSGDGADEIPDFRDGEGEDVEVPESPEKETEIGVHEEHENGSNCIVYFDGEQGSESAGAEPDVHDSLTDGRLNGEKKQLESENSSTSEDGSDEIEEEQDGELSKDLDAVNQPTGDVIEEELEIEDVEDYDVEKVLDNQETHDLFCPNCNSCITKRIVLKRRKRKIRHVLEDPKRLRVPHQNEPVLHSEDNLPSADVGENNVRESFVFKCLSCLSIFIPIGADSKSSNPSEGIEGLKTRLKPEEESTRDSNWFSSIFGFKNKESGGKISSVPEANPRSDYLSLPGEDTTGSTANTSAQAPTLVQDGAATTCQDGSEINASQDKKPLETPSIQVANSQETSEVVSNGATVEDGQKLLAPLAEEQTLQKIEKDDANVVNGNNSSDNGDLSQIQPSRDMNVSTKVTSGPDGVRVETLFHTEDVSNLFEGTDTSKPDLGHTKVPDVMNAGNIEVITGSPSPVIDIPPASSVIREPLLTRPVVEGRTLEILKSIVYGGLIESITSLGVISSAAGSGASTLNILVLGLANLFGGLILIIHNLQELREEEPIRPPSENNQTNSQVVEGRYKRLLGQRQNFTLHASVAILSFIIVGLLPPIVYYFSFSKTQNKDYKVASVLLSSLLCIVLLAIAKAHVKSPRGSYLKSVLYYGMIAVSVSGISYEVGNFVDQLLEKYGWSDGSETPARQMMISLMGRKTGSFGYSSSY